MRTRSVLFLALAFGFCFVLATWAQDEDTDPAALAEHVPSEVLVRFARKAPPAAVLDAARAVGAEHSHAFDQLRIRHWRVGNGLSAEKAIEILGKRPFIEFAEPNYVYSAVGVPDDPRFAELWGLHNGGQTGGTPDADIDAPEAWDIQTGSRSVVVAVIDTGIDYLHEDLAMNMWFNEGEIPPDVKALLTDADGDGVLTYVDLNDPANQGPGRITDLNGNGFIDGDDLRFTAAEGGWADGLDSDGNGYVDDLVGAGGGFYPMDRNGHGSHVAGTIGAAANNGIGVAGINWKVRIMPLKGLGDSGSGSTSNLTAAILDAASRWGNDTVGVINASWGSYQESQTMKSAIATSGILFVAAAGNDGNKRKTYPAASDLDNIVSVAATDHNDQRAGFSSWHETAVDLGAPGAGILSTVPTGVCNWCNPGNTPGYDVWSGTSMATPHVTGVAALILAQDPTMDTLAVKARILATVDPLSSLQGRTVTGGRLNAFAALPPQPGPGIVVTPTQGLVITEAGGTDSFTVVLKTQPAADVSIALSSSDTSEGTVSPASLTLTAANWNVPQAVTVTGVDDALIDGDVAYTILLAPAASADPAYNGLDAADVAATNIDDDAPGVTVSGISPATMSAGSTVGVVISGSGFVGGATVSFENGSGPAPTASSVVVADANTITATVSVSGTGPKGSRVWDVRVTSPGGASGVLVNGFTVIK